MIMTIATFLRGFIFFSGGVFTTAAAFSRTTILEKLKSVMKYEVLSSK